MEVSRFINLENAQKGLYGALWCIRRMKYSCTGILLSLICIVVALKINYEMSVEYYTIVGKSRAFMGLRHLDRFYFGGIGFIGIIFGLIAIRKKERPLFIALAILLAILSILLTYLDIWRWMI